MTEDQIALIIFQIKRLKYWESHKPKPSHDSYRLGMINGLMTALSICDQDPTKLIGQD